MTQTPVLPAKTPHPTAKNMAHALPSIELHDFSLAYPNRVLLSHVDLTIAQGQWVALLGTSGCGKSTLIKTIAGIEQEVIQSGQLLLHTSDANSLQINTKPYSAQKTSDITPIAYMAQQDALLPWLSLVQNVQFPQRLHGQQSPQTIARAKEVLQQVGLAEHMDKKPYQISGGQRQRVALARTLMMAADIVLMDEPFSKLDAITRMELQQLATRLLANKTVILITHDPAEAIKLADVIYVFRQQKLTPAFVPKGQRPRFDPNLAQPQLQQALLEALI